MNNLEEQRHQYLKKIIIQKIAKEGLITFKDFMELALYHDDYGYYTSPRQKIGRQGDYYTSVHVSHLFGQAVARQLVEMGSYLGWDNLVLIEYGAGEGYLAKDILDSLLEQLPQGARNIPYYICERSRYHRLRQKERLQEFVDQVHWIEDLKEINNGKSFVGIVFSNELVDAFPVHRVKQIDGQLQEIYVDYEKDSFIERLGDLSGVKLRDYFPFLGFNLEEGQEAEINLAALEWLENLSRYLDKGFILTIDYGYEINDLTNPRRFDGTVMCYRKHQADAKPLEGVGLKDITSHVNFTALVKYGEKYGIESTGFTNQMKFLVGLRIGQEMDNLDLPEHDRQRLTFALKELLMPDRMGERFQVLIQQKGFSKKPILSGLKGFG